MRRHLEASLEFVFEWDEGKADANLGRHRVSFDEASTIFGDPLSLTVPDPIHSDEEEPVPDHRVVSKWSTPRGGPC